MYFLAPLILAVGLLLLEAGIVSGKLWLQNAGLVIPVLCLALSFPFGRGASAPYVDFLQRFLDRVGSPVWLASLAAIGFYALASVRRVRFAGGLLCGALLIGSSVSRATVDFSSLMPPQPWALWLIAAGQGIVGIRRRDSLRVFAAAVCAIAGSRAALPASADLSFRAFLPMHAVGLVILIVGAVFDDPFARRLRRAGMLLVTAAIATAALYPPAWPTGLPWWSLPVYLAVIVGITFGYAYFVQSRAWFFGGVAGLCLFTGRALYDMTGYLKRLLAWEGAGWFVWGLIWFAVAVLISVRKAGLIGRMARIIPGADRK
jgi:hypothetical protein